MTIVSNYLAIIKAYEFLTRDRVEVKYTAAQVPIS